MSTWPDLPTNGLAAWDRATLNQTMSLHQCRAARMAAIIFTFIPAEHTVHTLEMLNQHMSVRHRGLSGAL